MICAVRSRLLPMPEAQAGRLIIRAQTARKAWAPSWLLPMTLDSLRYRCLCAILSVTLSRFTTALTLYRHVQNATCHLWANHSTR
jgi:hypothetical protein